jgi:anti-sigma factor RsiW
MPDTHHHNRQCRELFAKLSEYLDNELDKVTCRDIEDHLRQCKPCQVCLHTLKRTVALCHELKASSVPQDFSDRLRLLLARQLEGR